MQQSKIILHNCRVDTCKVQFSQKDKRLLANESCNQKENI